MTPGAVDVPVLMYHEITSAPTGSARLAVSPRSFAAQMAHLHGAGFSSVTAGRFAAAVAGGPPLPAKPVVLTFDDGFADFHEVALPILQRYAFTATLFMTTGWIRDAREPAGSAPGAMLSWNQLAEIAAAGIEVGGHTHQHPQLDRLTAGAVTDELVSSKHALEDGLGQPVPGLAYPFGYSSADVRRRAADVGYSYACAVGNRPPGPKLDRFAVPRLTVTRSTGLNRYARLADCRNLRVTFLKDRSLTTGWAMVRHARAGRRHGA